MINNVPVELERERERHVDYHWVTSLPVMGYSLTHTHTLYDVLKFIIHISSPLQEAQVTVDCVIHHKHHRSILGPKGSNVQAITQEYNVTIKFPDRESKQEKVQYMSLYVFLFLFYSNNYLFQ